MHTFAFSSFEETVGSHLKLTNAKQFFYRKKKKTLLEYFTVYFELSIKNVKFNNEYFSFLFQVKVGNGPTFRFYFR